MKLQNYNKLLLIRKKTRNRFNRKFKMTIEIKKNIYINRNNISNQFIFTF